MEVAGLSGTSPFSRFTLLAPIVAGLMDFENVSTTCEFSPALLVPLVGEMVTVGGVVSAVFAVVNVYQYCESEFPASSFSPFTPMYIRVEAGYGLRGVKVTVLPLTLNDPATYNPATLSYTSTVLLFTDAGSIGLLIVKLTGLLTEMPIAPLTGLVESTVNDPLPTDAIPVVNELVKVVTVLPCTSLKPPTETLYGVEALNAPAGTNVSVTPSLASVTVPATDGVRVIELVVTVVGSIESLITAITCVFSGTPVCPLAGLMVLTVAWVVSEPVPVTKLLLKPSPVLPATS